MRCGSLSCAFVVLHIFSVNNQEIPLLQNNESVDQRPSSVGDLPKIWKEDWKLKTYNQSLWLVHLNNTNHVAIYFDENLIKSVTKQNTSTSTVEDDWFVRNPHWVFNFAPKVWRYMTDTYGKFGPDMYLYLVIRGANLPTASTSIGSHYEYSLDPKNIQRKNILDVTSPSMDAEESDITQNENMDLLTNKLANFVESSSKQRLGSPSLSTWKSLTNKEPSAWVDIFTYDVYTNLNLIPHAQRYNQTVIYKNSATTSTISSNQNLFQNWFYPIYSNYGGNIVLNKYFELLSQHLPHDNEMYEYQLTTGDFVHFWSGAAKSDLIELAKLTFKWNPTFADQLINARKNFPLNYTETDRQLPENAETGKLELTHVIIGASIIAVGILALVAKLCIYRKRNKNLQMEIRDLTPEEVNDFFDGDPTKTSDESDAQAMVLAMPFIMDYEIPRDQIIIDTTKVLGSGQFGTVIQGFVGENGSEKLTSVALKTVKSNVDVIYFKAFLSEVKIMAYLGKHDNIVGLIGTCTSSIKNREIFIALEFCTLGNMENYLQKNRNNFEVDYVTFDRTSFTDIVLRYSTAPSSTPDSTHENTKTIKTMNLLRWSHQICNAMIYLTQKKVIHGDLAARNILLTENRTAKISDFGLSRQFLNYANYLKKSKLPVPWRWLAIESLKEMKFSTASDVWAFGVTMWEIFSLGELPYGACNYDLFFVDKLKGGDRLLRPSHGNDQTYQLMKDCWKLKPSERPTFQQIYDRLGEFISKPSRFNNSTKSPLSFSMSVSSNDTDVVESTV